MAALAVHKLAALELLVERRTDARAARAARVVGHFDHGHALALLEDALELAAGAVGQRLLQLRGALAQRLGLGAQVAQRMLPLVVLRVPPLLERGGAAAIVIELLLQALDVRHRLQLRVLELLDVLARGVDLLPRGGVLLLILHLHELPLILLEQLLLVGQLAVDAAALLAQRVDLLLQLLHLRVDRLPLEVDRGERLRLAVQLFFALTERGQDGLQFPKFLYVPIHRTSGGSTRIRTWDLPVMSR
jgi:hypothetical protein